jgi:SAM-dependent methyltransferase
VDRRPSIELPRSFSGLEDLAVKGDWETRVLALSAIGRMIRDDRTAWRPSPIRHLGWYVPAVRRIFPTVGRRGVFARGPLLNALSDRAWIVRMAASLALGECRDADLAPALRRLLDDHYRPVRTAAAAALLAAGSLDVLGLQIGGESAPRTLGVRADARVWVSRLLRDHAALVSALSTLPEARGTHGDPDLLTLFVGPEPPDDIPSDYSAEVTRYAQEADNRHNLAKPFAPGPRDQNTRLLHTFLSLSEHMDVPYNGRVLDLCGGAGWVSELVAKLGYRPATVDVSVPLLKLAGQRFREQGLLPRLVTADALALPFRDGVFDTVLIFDALHHVGDLAIALREVFRVLVDGGQFLLAEPGEGHSETEKSRGERTEYGVREGEIHVFEVTELAAAAGFRNPRIIPHFVPALHLTPDDLRHAVSHGVEEWRMRHRTGSTARMDEYVLQSIFSHPIMSFSKGARTVDSRAPQVLKASVVAELTRHGTDVRGVVHIQNIGDTLWLGQAGPGMVRLGIQLLAPDRTMINRDFARCELSGSVPPGATIDIPVAIGLPHEADAYVLKLDLVSEHICWFEDVGSVPLYVDV